MSEQIKIRELTTGQSWFAKVDDLEQVLDVALNYVDLDGGGKLTLRFMTHDSVVETIEVYRNAKGRLVASRNGRPARLWKIVTWAFKIRKLITGRSLEFTLQIGGLTCTFDESQLSVILKRQTFINKREIKF